MAHFAQLDEQNKVTQVIVVSNETVNNLPFPESEPLGIEFCKALCGQNTIWKQTSYNANFRKNYAGVGYTFDPVLDAFIPHRPFPSWNLNVETGKWDPPIPYPPGGASVIMWDETNQQWITTND